MTTASLDFEVKNIGTEKDVEVNINFRANIPEEASSELEDYIYHKALASVKDYLAKFMEEEFPEERLLKITDFLISQKSKPD